MRIPSKITPELLEILEANNLSDIFTAAKVEAIIDPVEKYLAQFITGHSSMLELKNRTRIAATVDDPVLIVGDSGTGKELIAQALHGDRKGKFVDVNCAGLPEHLIESELFGHVRGAFTDAKTEKKGMFEEASNGTIFLDEIGELQLWLQAKLLRAIQEKKIRRVGANDSIDINCRIVSATHHDIKKLIATGKFRDDLYWRISTILLETRPLKDRSGDVRLILGELDYEGKMGSNGLFEKVVSRIEASPERHLVGNVRQLQQIVRRYYLFGDIPS